MVVPIWPNTLELTKSEKKVFNPLSPPFMALPLKKKKKKATYLIHGTKTTALTIWKKALIYP